MQDLIGDRGRPWFAGLALSLLLGGCVPRGAPVGAPVADPEGAAAELRRATTPEAPQNVTFAWTFNEAGSTLRGRGVARLEAPERIRLDLFGARGETYLSAALVGEEFRLPQALPPGLALPSPALLWAAVGVVRPPAAARLVDASETDGELIVRYDAGGGELFEYRASREPLRLVRASRAGPRGVRESLQLSWGADTDLRSTRYRDLEAYRELTLSVESRTSVASFPPAIWSPDGPSR